jgi:hypothetical protein
MEPEANLHVHKIPWPVVYPGPDESDPLLKFNFPNIHFNIILLCTPSYSKWPLPSSLNSRHFMLIPD